MATLVQTVVPDVKCNHTSDFCRRLVTYFGHACLARSVGYSRRDSHSLRSETRKNQGREATVSLTVGVYVPGDCCWHMRPLDPPRSAQVERVSISRELLTCALRGTEFVQDGSDASVAPRPKQIIARSIGESTAAKGPEANRSRIASACRSY